jgi:hypothetical protein
LIEGFGIRIKWDFLGLNGIDFLDFWDSILPNPKNQSHLILKNPI